MRSGGSGPGQTLAARAGSAARPRRLAYSARPGGEENSLPAGLPRAREEGFGFFLTRTLDLVLGWAEHPGHSVFQGCCRELGSGSWLEVIFQDALTGIELEMRRKSQPFFKSACP